MVKENTDEISNINLVASTELLSNMKGVYLIGKVAGAAASFIAIVDGLVACVKDLPRFYAGDSGALGFQIGSIMEITAGVLGLFALAGLCFPGIGWVILGLAVVGMLLKGQFSDDSDSWDVMQWWFNRCPYGLHDHVDKQPPYPETHIAMYQCLADFYSFVQGYHFSWSDLDCDNDVDRLFIEKDHNRPQNTSNNPYGFMSAEDGEAQIGRAVGDLFLGKLARKAGYINVALSNFILGESFFRITIALQSKDHPGQTVTLRIEPRTDAKAKLAKVVQTYSTSQDISEWFMIDNLRTELIGEEYYDFGDGEEHPIKTSWYIQQKLCEINGNYGVFAFIHYYPEGEGEGKFPKIIEYKYNC